MHDLFHSWKGLVDDGSRNIQHTSPTHQGGATSRYPWATRSCFPFDSKPSMTDLRDGVSEDEVRDGIPVLFTWQEGLGAGSAAWGDARSHGKSPGARKVKDPCSNSMMSIAQAGFKTSAARKLNAGLILKPACKILIMYVVWGSEQPGQPVARNGFVHSWTHMDCTEGVVSSCTCWSTTQFRSRASTKQAPTRASMLPARRGPRARMTSPAFNFWQLVRIYCLIEDSTLRNSRFELATGL